LKRIAPPEQSLLDSRPTNAIGTIRGAVHDGTGACSRTRLARGVEGEGDEAVAACQRSDLVTHAAGSCGNGEEEDIGTATRCGLASELQTRRND